MPYSIRSASRAARGVRCGGRRTRPGSRGAGTSRRPTAGSGSTFVAKAPRLGDTHIYIYVGRRHVACRRRIVPQAEAAARSRRATPAARSRRRHVARPSPVRPRPRGFRFMHDDPRSKRPRAWARGTATSGTSACHLCRDDAPHGMKPHGVRSPRPRISVRGPPLASTDPRRSVEGRSVGLHGRGQR